MKNLKRIALAIVALGIFAAAGSAQLPCIALTANAWQPIRPAYVENVRVVGGGQWIVPFYMPVAGRCVGSFTSYDDRDDLATMITDATGMVSRKKAAGDIEIMVLNEFELGLRNRNRTHSMRWTSGRQFGGTFDIYLQPGNYTFVISNWHSTFTPKSVTLTVGKSEITP